MGQSGEPRCRPDRVHCAPGLKPCSQNGKLTVQNCSTSPSLAQDGSWRSLHVRSPLPSPQGRRRTQRHSHLANHYFLNRRSTFLPPPKTPMGKTPIFQLPTRAASQGSPGTSQFWDEHTRTQNTQATPPNIPKIPTKHSPNILTHSKTPTI